MAEVTTRGGGLPRGGGHQRGRGRGRGSFNPSSGHHLSNGSSDPNHHPNNHKLNGHRTQQNHGQISADQEEPEELKNIRKKHGRSLPTIKELFPTWTDEDLLMALNEASGDLELAASRISEGLAEQWGSVKSKKEKKTAVPTSSSAPSGRGHGSGPGAGSSTGRGRGDYSRVSSRGGGRGAAPRGAAHGHHTSGSSRPPSHAIGREISSTATPSAWSVGPPSFSANEANLGSSIATAGANNGETSSLSLTNVSGWGENKPDSGAARDGRGSNVETTKPSPPEPAKKTVSRVIDPSSKMSWAQIARPADPPKPSQAPSSASQVPSLALDAQPAAESANQTSQSPEATGVSDVVSSSQLAGDQITISIPDATADVWNTEPVPAIDDLKSKVTGAGPNVWNDDPVLQPLGVGEGWAESVLAQPGDPKPSIFDNQASAVRLLTPSDAVHIGPIEMAPTPTSALEQPGTSSTPPVASATDHGLQAAEGTSIHLSGAQPSVPPSSSSILAPPGLTKRASARKGQEAAVVMPGSGTPTVDRVGLKFGSLSLFGDIKEGADASQAPALDTPSPPLPSTDDKLAQEANAKSEERRPEPATQPAEKAPSPSPPAGPQVMEEKAPFTTPSVVVNYNASHPPTQPAAAPSSQQAPPANPLAQQQSHNPPTAQSQSSAAQLQSSSFASRYSAGNQYASTEPGHSAATFAQASQPQQDAFPHHPAFRQDPMSAYFQQQQAQQQQQSQQPAQQPQPQPQSSIAQNSTTPAPTSQAPASYGSFNHATQQVPQQTQQSSQTAFGQPPQSAPEYAALYGQEALRSLGYYETYAHAQAAQVAFQNRSAHGTDETSKASTTTQPNVPQSQTQQSSHHQHQQHHQQQHHHHHQQQQQQQQQAQQQQQQQQQPAGVSASASSQQYPGMQPSPMPYSYYPYYQQYGQLPPNYQNPAYPYSLQAPSPYYSAQGSQQYSVGGARNAQSQYPLQAGPGSSASSGVAPLLNSHAHQQQQHASQHGLAGVGIASTNPGFRQVSQPGAGGTQIPTGQVSGQGVTSGNVGMVSQGMPTGQQPGSMHQQHPYYGSNYSAYGADPQQRQPQQGGVGGSGSSNAAHHHHPHHHSQQQQQHSSRQANHQHQHHHAQNAGQGIGGGQETNERKDPFAFSSDRFFNQ